MQVTIAVSDDEGDNSTSDTTEIIESTPDHPVYVEEKGWVWAENLETGDQLRQADGNFVEVVIVEYEQLDELELVYNFTVEGPHTYFVLETAVLMHNCGEIQEGGGESDKIVLYHSVSGKGLQRFQQNGLQIRSSEEYRGAGLYTTPKAEEALECANSRHTSDSFLLRFEIDRQAFEQLSGKTTGIYGHDTVNPMRAIAESRTLNVNPKLRKGFPSDPDSYYNEVVKSLSPNVDRGLSTPIDYLQGSVPLPRGSFGTEYVFKSEEAIQGVLNNTDVTRISVLDPLDNSQTWNQISFPNQP